MAVVYLWYIICLVNPEWYCICIDCSLLFTYNIAISYILVSWKNLSTQIITDKLFYRSTYAASQRDMKNICCYVCILTPYLYTQDGGAISVVLLIDLLTSRAFYSVLHVFQDTQVVGKSRNVEVMPISYYALVLYIQLQASII